jgi:hypothetical protein
MKTVLWDVTTHSLVDMCQYPSALYHEDGGRFLQNTGTYIPNNTTSRPRRQLTVEQCSLVNNTSGNAMVLLKPFTLEQPGVKAPGTAKITTFFPLVRSEMFTLLVGVFSQSSTLGSLSPTCNTDIPHVRK